MSALAGVRAAASRAGLAVWADLRVGRRVGWALAGLATLCALIAVGVAVGQPKSPLPDARDLWVMVSADDRGSWGIDLKRAGLGSDPAALELLPNPAANSRTKVSSAKAPDGTLVGVDVYGYYDVLSLGTTTSGWWPFRTSTPVLLARRYVATSEFHVCNDRERWWRFTIGSGTPADGGSVAPASLSNRGTAPTGPPPRSPPTRGSPPDPADRWDRGPNGLTAEENAAAAQYGFEFGLTDEQPFVDAANRFVSNPPATAEVFVMPNGDAIVYDPPSNTYAYRTSWGVPAAFRRMSPGSWEGRLATYGGRRSGPKESDSPADPAKR